MEDRTTSRQPLALCFLCCMLPHVLCQHQLSAHPLLCVLVSYYFRACGNVTAPACAAIEGTATSPMICQSTLGGSAVSLGWYSQSYAYWSIPQAGVVQMWMQVRYDTILRPATAAAYH